jgi:hypothetical protein
MNILPFVTTFLLILALSSHAIIEKGISSHQLKKSYGGYLKASRTMQNFYLNKCFKKIKDPSPAKKKPNSESKAKQKTFTKLRLNVFLLFLKGKEDQKELYDIFINLLKKLYENKNFFSEQKNSISITFFADKVIEKAHKFLNSKKGDLQLEKLNFDNDAFQLVYYKVLKGSKLYNPEKNFGYPSIFDFIELNTQNTKIPIPYCSLEVLESIFNKKIALAIQNKQIKDNSFNPISKEELKSILEKNNFYSKDQNKLFSLFTFSKNPLKGRKKIELVGKDKLTDIPVRRTFYLKT